MFEGCWITEEDNEERGILETAFWYSSQNFVLYISDLGSSIELSSHRNRFQWSIGTSSCEERPNKSTAIKSTRRPWTHSWVWINPEIVRSILGMAQTYNRKFIFLGTISGCAPELFSRTISSCTELAMWFARLAECSFRRFSMPFI